MTCVVTAACIPGMNTDCVYVSLFEAFRESLNLLVLDPDECISERTR